MRPGAKESIAVVLDNPAELLTAKQAHDEYVTSLGYQPEQSPVASTLKFHLDLVTNIAPELSVDMGMTVGLKPDQAGFILTSLFHSEQHSEDDLLAGAVIDMLDSFEANGGNADEVVAVWHARYSQ